jgi:ATP-dependent RNA helicase DDX27
MELTKGRNLIEHQTEIMARPARTWFQTQQEKTIAKSERRSRSRSNVH